MNTAYKSGRFARTPIQSSLILVLTAGLLPSTSFAAPIFAQQGAISGQVLQSAAGVPVTFAATAGVGGSVMQAVFPTYASAASATSPDTNQLAVGGSSVEPDASSMARASLVYSTFTNTSPDVTRVSYSYRIEAGSLRFLSSNSGGYAEVFNSAAQNGGVSDYGSLKLNSNGLAITIDNQSGDFLSLNGFTFNALTGATWMETNYSRILADVAPGGSLDFSYSMSGRSALSATGFCCSGTPCNASFQIGDPNSFSNAIFLGMGLTFEALTNNGQVPLPATLALTAIGVAGIGATRRKRRPS